ncbi:hypothetical protein ebA3773 [Aromatoleum aromaticum EbN1]|uniref:Uncharacterized protein n=1 Tax=Aromatoleum aromaticum (strain DSM 19018 / LMG 30748 / EbN1) TaxID=76114 RepID=Q5P364_AROAE|nr:hypothetical protein ebA3773 [Aromatoleum aromaticum EbN1]
MRAGGCCCCNRCSITSSRCLRWRWSRARTADSPATSKSATAACRRWVPDHRRQYFPEPEGQRAAGNRTRALDRGGEAGAVEAPRRLPGAQWRRSAEVAREAAPGRHRGRQRLRSARRCGALLLARPDHVGAVRGRRAVPAQHVRGNCSGITETAPHGAVLLSGCGGALCLTTLNGNRRRNGHGAHGTDPQARILAECATYGGDAIGRCPVRRATP